MLPDDTRSNLSIKDLEKLVQELKKDKARYCKEFSAYEQDSREVWNKIYQE